MFKRTGSGYSKALSVDWLIVGLGNPGVEYEGSPHNAGFAVTERLAQAAGIRPITKHQGLWGTGELDDIPIALLMPLTYMNLSGQSVKPAMKSLGLSAEQLVVIHDEIDLDFGRVQVKVGGGLAGHNGLKSIADLVGTREFVRIRLGVGRPDPGDRRPISDWILKPFPADRDTEALYTDGERAARTVLQDGIRAATKRFT